MRKIPSRVQVGEHALNWTAMVRGKYNRAPDRQKAVCRLPLFTQWDHFGMTGKAVSPENSEVLGNKS